MDYVAIPAAVLEVEDLDAAPFFAASGEGVVPLRADGPEAGEALGRAKARGLVFVRACDLAPAADLFEARLEGCARSWTEAEGDALERFEASGVAAVLGFAQRPSRARFEVLARYAKALADLVRTRPRAAVPLYLLGLGKSAAWTRSAHVAGLALRAASEARRFSPKRMQDLAVAAMVRDLGMERLPAQVRDARGRIRGDDRAILREHVRHSRDILKEAGVGDGVIRRIVIEHHERLDGSGYPLGLRGPDMHPLSALVGACDALSALMAPRPHRPAMKPFDALQLMLRQEAGKFDVDWIKALIAVFAPPASNRDAAAA